MTSRPIQASAFGAHPHWTAGARDLSGTCVADIGWRWIEWPDRALAVRCAEEDLVLLTKDRILAATITGTAQARLLPRGGIDETARACAFAVDIDWL